IQCIGIIVNECRISIRVSNAVFTNDISKHRVLLSAGGYEYFKRPVPSSEKTYLVPNANTQTPGTLLVKRQYQACISCPEPSKDSSVNVVVIIFLFAVTGITSLNRCTPRALDSFNDLF